MEFANRLVGVATRAANSNAVINVCLIASFAALSVRSINQQKNIEALEAEKDSLIKSNKAMKKTMWDWKQQLFAKAEAEAGTILVPLARLKAIYGEVTSPPTGSALDVSVVNLENGTLSIWKRKLWSSPR